MTPAPKLALFLAAAACLCAQAAAAPCEQPAEGYAVTLRALVEADGSLSQVKIKHSSGCAPLDAHALRTVRQWKFKPGTRNGVPERMWFTVPLRYQSASEPPVSEAASPAPAE